MATTDGTPFDGESLSRTLATALNHSYQLRDSLNELRRENGNLKLQIEKLHENFSSSSKQKHDLALENLRRENQTLKAELANAQQASQPAGQVAHLFQQNAEKQAEIDSLKAKLRALQSQKRKRPKTPPEFWGVDVLGSQQERDSREQAEFSK